MSRAGLFGVLVMWLIIITYILNSVITFDATAGLSIDNPIGLFGAVEGNTFEQTTTMLGTYWGALTFSVGGLPVIFNLCFQIPTAIIGFMILQFLRGN